MNLNFHFLKFDLDFFKLEPTNYIDLCDEQDIVSKEMIVF